MSTLSYEDVNIFALQNLLLCKASSKGYNWNARCPFCGDSKKNKHLRRFHLKFEDGHGYFNCFNCGESGTFYKLYAFVTGCSINEAIDQFRKFDTDRIKKQFDKTNSSRKITETTPSKNFNWIVPECIQNPSTRKERVLLDILHKFRSSRRIDPEYTLYVKAEGEFANRIIIPIIEDENIIYFQARSILDTQQPKYLNPVAEKGNIILNRNLFNQENYIIVTEGLIDAMSIENHAGTACLGASVSDEWLNKLNKYTTKGIILALDNDETGIKKLNKFLKETSITELKYFLMPEKYKKFKDINDLKVSELESNMYEFIVENSYSSFKTSVLLKLKE